MQDRRRGKTSRLFAYLPLRQPPARWAGRPAFLAYLGHCADRHGNGVCMWVGRGVGVLGVGGGGEAGI